MKNLVERLIHEPYLMDNSTIDPNRPLPQQPTPAESKPTQETEPELDAGDASKPAVPKPKVETPEQPRAKAANAEDPALPGKNPKAKPGATKTSPKTGSQTPKEPALTDAQKNADWIASTNKTELGGGYEADTQVERDLATKMRAGQDLSGKELNQVFAMAYKSEFADAKGHLAADGEHQNVSSVKTGDAKTDGDFSGGLLHQDGNGAKIATDAAGQKYAEFGYDAKDGSRQYFKFAVNEDGFGKYNEPGAGVKPPVNEAPGSEKVLPPVNELASKDEGLVPDLPRVSDEVRSTLGNAAESVTSTFGLSDEAGRDAANAVVDTLNAAADKVDAAAESAAETVKETVHDGIEVAKEFYDETLEAGLDLARDNLPESVINALGLSDSESTEDSPAYKLWEGQDSVYSDGKTNTPYEQSDEGYKPFAQSSNIPDALVNADRTIVGLHGELIKADATSGHFDLPIYKDGAKTSNSILLKLDGNFAFSPVAK